MRTRKLHLEFATFICKFGSKDLVDGAEAIVLPAFFSQRSRRYGRTAYLFHEPALVELAEHNVGVAFEFVKSTVLEREQIFNAEIGLVSDSDRIESAPSAMALLVLQNHRLVYLPKTRHAPTLRELETTCRVLFKQQWHSWLAASTRGLGRPESAERRRRLALDLPKPEVTILPLSSAEQIEQSIRRFDVIKKLSIQLAERNSEYDPREFFEQLRAEKVALGSASSSVVHASPDGLAKPEVRRQVHAATQQGTARVRVQGSDHEGHPLVQENEDVRVRVPATFEPPATSAEAAGPMFDALVGLVETGILKAPALIANVGKRVRAVVDKWNARK